MGHGRSGEIVLPFQVLLDGMEGVSYVVGRDGVLLACGRRNWAGFARENGGDRIVDPGSVIGRPILDFVDGEDVLAAYRGYMASLFAGTVEAVAFEFRCDAPDTRRDLWMTIRPLESGGRVDSLLFQTITLRHLPRPPVSLFDFETLRAHVMGRMSLPIVKMCAYCARVTSSAEEAGEPEWMAAEDYYRKGGTSEVRLSHGICDTCHGRYVSPFLAEDT